MSENITHKYPNLVIPHAFPRFSLIPAILFSGAIGSFLVSAVDGKKSINNISFDLFVENSKPKSSYQQTMITNQSQIKSLHEESFLRREEAIKKTEEDRKEREKWGPPKN